MTGSRIEVVQPAPGGLLRWGSGRSVRGVFVDSLPWRCLRWLRFIAVSSESSYYQSPSRGGLIHVVVGARRAVEVGQGVTFRERQTLSTIGPIAVLLGFCTLGSHQLPAQRVLLLQGQRAELGVVVDEVRQLVGAAELALRLDGLVLGLVWLRRLGRLVCSGRAAFLLAVAMCRAPVMKKGSTLGALISLALATVSDP